MRITATAVDLMRPKLITSADGSFSRAEVRVDNLESALTNRILILGVPRSGSTWVGRTLSRTPGSIYVHEPDNFDYPARFTPVLRRQLGPFPMVTDEERAPYSYTALWDLAFSARFPRRDLSRSVAHWAALLPADARGVALAVFPRRPAAWIRRPRNIIVKSVHSAFAAEWIAGRYSPRVVVIRRNLLSVVASWLRLGFDRYHLDAETQVLSRLLSPLDIPGPRPTWSRVARLSWEVGVLATALEHAIARNPTWLVVDHEVLCGSPVSAMSSLCTHLGLDWSPRAAKFLRASNRPGEGFETNRITRAEPDKWRQLLDGGQVGTIRDVIGRFKLGGWALGNADTEDGSSAAAAAPGAVL